MGINLLPAHIGAGIDDAHQPQLGLLVVLIILVTAEHILGAPTIPVLFSIDVALEHGRITKSTGSGSAVAPPPPELWNKYLPRHYACVKLPNSLLETILIKIETLPVLVVALKLPELLVNLAV